MRSHELQRLRDDVFPLARRASSVYGRGDFEHVTRGADRARPSITLINRIAQALELPDGYFPEQREAAVIQMIQRNPALRDQLHARLKPKPPLGALLAR